MIKINFRHPPTGTNNPFSDFQPWNESHYPTGQGIYIYGLKLKIDNMNKFVPIAVGESKDLLRRLHKNHYKCLISNGSSRKEIFDWASCQSALDAQIVYGQMNLYSELPSRGSRRIPLVCAMSRIHANRLIWFNNKEFFNSYIGMPLSNYLCGAGHQASIDPVNGDLKINFQKNNVATKLCSKIINNKTLFDRGFYFLYATNDEDKELDFSILADRLNFEKSVKRLMADKLGIYTTADSRRGREIPGLQLDFSSIQDDLICLPGNNYGYPAYTKPLIL